MIKTNISDILCYLKMMRRMKENDFKSLLEIICNFLYNGENENN